MVDPRVGTLAVSLALLLFAALATRGRGRLSSAEDLGGVPPVLELDVQAPSGVRRLRIPRSALIGRSPSAAIRLEEPTVSRLHARIERRDERVYVEDLGSRNGTLLNGKPVRNEALLSPGDRVRIGSTDIVFVGAGEWK